MGMLDDTFGATYIGVVLATFLYGIMTLQSYIYWVRYVHDSMFDRLFVVALWVIDTLQLVFICHMQYWYVIDNYANPVALQFNDWSFNMEVGLTAIITFMVQGFFARRAWYFTSRIGNRNVATQKTRVLGILIGIISFTQLGFGMGCFGMVWVLKRWTQFIDYNWLVAGWLASAALCDVLIVYMLSTALMTQRTGFGRTDALIDKLLRYTINTGLLTSLVAITDLIAFCTMNNLIHLAFNFVLGKLYTNTLLATLNAREPTPPENIVHVESGSYQMDKRSHSRKQSRGTAQMLSGQERSNPVVHITTDTEAQITDTYHRHPHDQYSNTKVVVLNGKDHTDRHDGYDPDGDSFENSKRGTGF
ncbi:transmembrane protein [Ceratobasidium sp. AG-Ba]|nr:transmembrane protein [Ceratobasidium sp. AG-Ba]